MFIKNFECLDKSLVLRLDDDDKTYLQSLGFEPISYDSESDLWYFIACKEISGILSNREENYEKA